MEEKIIITSDSTCDLSPELIVANDIRIFPLRVILGSETYRDGIDITPQEIFAYVEKTGVLPKTSAPNTEDYLKFFAPISLRPRRGKSAKIFLWSIRMLFLRGRDCSS